MFTIKHFLINLGTLVSSKVASMAAQFLILPIMARYISPSEFGTVALAMAFVTLSMALSDAGLGASLVRTKAYDALVWSSAFWMILGIGFSFSLFLVLLAQPLSVWFGDPEVASLMYALAIIPILQSSIAIPLAHLQKEGEMGLVSSAEVFATLLSFAVAVLVAVNGGGAWALVFQQLVLWTLKALIIGIKSEIQIKLMFSLQALGEHLRFGKDVMAVAMVDLFKTQSHTIIISKYMGAAPLGFFTMAFRFIQLPVQLMSGPVAYVLYGHMARHKENKSAVRTILLASTRLLAIIIIPPIAMAAAAAEPLFTLLLSEKWSGVGDIYTYMAPASALMAVTLLSETVMLTMGATKLRLRLTLEMSLYWVGLLLISSQWGLNYVAIAFSVWYLTFLPRLLPAFLGTVNCSVGRYVRVFFWPILLSVLGALVHSILFGFYFLVGQGIELFFMLLEMMVIWGGLAVLEKTAVMRAFIQLHSLTRITEATSAKA